jgi:sugar phosphate isomerase/epimerase
MRFSICNEIFEGWALGDILSFVQEVGYDALEIAPFTLGGTVRDVTVERRREIRRMVEETGMAVSAIHWVLAHTEGFHLTSPDPVVRKRTAAYFVDLVDFGADIGAPAMVVGSPKQRSLGRGISAEEGCSFAYEVLAPAVMRAAERGLTICIEPLAPAETNFLNTAADARRFADLFASRSMDIILDVKAMSAESMSVPEVIRASGGRFGYFHANDSNLRGPGFGEVDFRPIGDALKEVGYTGTVSVEVFRFEEGARTIATRSREYLRAAFGF